MKFLKKYKKIIYAVIIVVLIPVISNLYSGFIYYNETNGYVYYGFSGFQSLFNDNDKFKIYWKEYLVYELDGIDKEYLLYENNKKRVISVDENNIIFNKLVDSASIEIKSSHSKTEFKISDFDNNEREKPFYNTSGDIFVISDVEGDFDKFIRLLQKNNIINDSLKWNYSNGHVVLLGDFFDRGDDVTAVLWLCYKLEQEAEKVGGKVHFILGNHEQMNLQGNVQDVNGKYQALVKKIGIPYKDLYGKNSELGRWLRSKNAIEIINNMLFCHGGISSNFIKLNESLYISNDKILKAIDVPIKKMYTIEGEDLGHPLYKYINLESPLWYRGYFSDWGSYKMAGQKDVDAVCNYYNVDKIIVGHTIVDEIKTHFNGKVIGIDVLRNHNNKNQKPSTLLIEENHFFAVDEHGRKFPIK